MEGRETGELRKLAYGGCVRWRGREQDSKLGGKKGKRRRDGGNRRGRYPGEFFLKFFLKFLFWMAEI